MHSVTSQRGNTNMRVILAAAMALSLSGCASFSGLGGQYQSTETIEIARRPANFYNDVVTIGQRLGYQHTGGNRGANTVNLTDQPNFGETMIGRAYSVQIMVALQPNGRAIDMTFTAVGSRTTAGANKSQERIDQLKAALAHELGGR